MLKGKNIVMGVTGGIAAWKACLILNKLVIDLHANVDVIMTKNSETFITEQTIRTLSRNIVTRDMFKEPAVWSVEHISLARKADCFLIAPCTANVIGKIANGIADDMLTTTILACKCPKLLSPAMNTAMFENPVVQDNLSILKKYGWEVIEPASGYLACGDTGAGKMPEPEVLLSHIEQHLACEKDLLGKKVLVTAGPTREALDPVRYLTNHSTGKMGYAIAHAASLRGADVTLVSGPVSIAPPPFVNVIPITSAQDMFEAVSAHAAEQDAIIKAAAVADYTPADVSSEKVKKKDGDMSIPLKRTTDILKYLGEHKHVGQFLCGFSMETEHMLENSTAKLTKKNVDMIVANNLKTTGAGFGTDTNVVTLITREGAEELPLMSKEEVAHQILNRIFK